MGTLPPSRVLLVLLAWSLAVRTADSNLCASLNTASLGKSVSIYQSNGLCKNTCLDKNKAFSIIQGNSCWCSDYAPAKSQQVDNSKCNQPCPGYPSENCGGSELFAYIPLNVLPSGTKGGDPEPTPTPSPKGSTEETNIDPRTTSERTSTSEPPPPATSIYTVTAGGTIQTVTISPVQTAPAVASESKASTEVTATKSGLGTGGVVGIAASVVVVSVGFAALALFLYFQSKRRRDSDFQEGPSVQGSSSGIIGGRSDGSSLLGSPGSTGNRSMLQVDPRMNPFKQGLYARAGSHESINTLRDDHDYSRRIQEPKVLRATNPDPAD